MSFLSSHRLHWGVHHELSDNFRLHLDHMIEEASSLAADSLTSNPSEENGPASRNTLAGEATPEALGP